MNCTIRKAEKKDVRDVLVLINELAEYENAIDEVEINEKQLLEDGFNKTPLFNIIVAEVEGKVVGMSFYYIRYSTWKGKSLYLEDLVVKQDYRKQKIGSMLFEATVNEAKNINANLICWQVLDWNKPAIEFYKKYNAAFDEEWLNCKLPITNEGI